jgi:hypothetical protein
MAHWGIALIGRAGRHSITIWIGEELLDLDDVSSSPRLWWRSLLGEYRESSAQ